MNFPYYEVELRVRVLEDGKYKAGYSIRQHAGDRILVILPMWELEQEFDNKGAANKVLKFNALQYLKRELGLNKGELARVKIIQN